MYFFELHLVKYIQELVELAPPESKNGLNRSALYILDSYPRLSSESEKLSSSFFSDLHPLTVILLNSITLPYLVLGIFRLEELQFLREFPG